MHAFAIAPVVSFFQEYQRRRDAWASSADAMAGQSAAAEAAEIWMKLVEARAMHQSEILLKMELLIEILAADYAEGSAVLAIANSIHIDMAEPPQI